jgi:hypothetical protein
MRRTLYRPVDASAVLAWPGAPHRIAPLQQGNIDRITDETARVALEEKAVLVGLGQHCVAMAGAFAARRPHAALSL